MVPARRAVSGKRDRFILPRLRVMFLADAITSIASLAVHDARVAL